MGCGWLGLPLAEHLLANKYMVKGSTTTAAKLPILKAKGIDSQLITLNPAIISDAPIDLFFQADILVLNLPPRGRRNPKEAAIYPKKIEHILPYILKSTISKVIFVSSTSVYQKNEDIITEDSLNLSDTPTAKALLSAEKMLQNQTHFETTILRFGGLIGENRHPGRFLAGRKNLSKGEERVNLVHQADGVAVIYKIIRQEKWNEVYNICADEHPSRQAFYTKSAQDFGLEPPTFLTQKADFLGIISNEKVKKDLSFSFKKGITYP